MRTAMKISLAVSMCIAGAAQAGVVLTAGPGASTSTPTAMRSPSINMFPGTPLNNVGTSTAFADKYSNGNNLGRRGVRFKAGGLVIELGGLTNANFVTSGESFAINDPGLIVGFATKPNALGRRAVRYDIADALSATELGALTPNNNNQLDAEAWAVNDAGMAVGFSDTYSNNVDKGTRAVRWSPGTTTATELGVISTRSDGLAYANASIINNAGTIAGSGARWGAGDVNLGFRAIRWGANSYNAFELDPVNTRNDGYAMSNVSAINSAGVVVGYSNRYSGANDMGERPVRWNTGGTAVTELNILGTDVNGQSSGFARAINNAGVVTGWVDKYDAQGNGLGFRAVRWDANSVAAVELGGLGYAPSGLSSIIGVSINNLGTISGSANAYTPAGASIGNRATLWLPGSNDALDLNTLLPAGSSWTLSQAYQVSDTGFVMGTAQYDPDGVGAQPAYSRLFSLLVPQAGTYGRGDANFDTLVNFDDLLLLAQHYGEVNPSLNIHIGDLNLDGTVNFDDLLSLAQNYGLNTLGSGGSVGGDFAEDWAIARSLVPEPILLPAFAVTLISATKRTRLKSWR